MTLSRKASLLLLASGLSAVDARRVKDRAAVLQQDAALQTSTEAVASAVSLAATPAQLLSCPGGAVQTTTCMTSAEYNAVVASVRSLLESLPETCDATVCPQADWAGCVLRVAGHDFMDFADGRGGSDACTDLDDIDNKGLAECLVTGDHGLSLKSAYEAHCTRVSLADFLVIAAEAVMTSTREREMRAKPSTAAIDFRSTFMFGRTTATECGFAHGRLPNPERGCAAVDETFVQRMGLSWDQAAALMGVHTLGRAKVENSGYHGWWSDPENSRRFNNDYFVSMLAKGWVPERSVAGNADKNQWARSDRGQDKSDDGHEMMLNTDLCLAFAIGGEPVLAQEHTCCAWLGAPGLNRLLASSGSKYCGGEPETRFGDMRAQCCNEDPRAIDCGNGRTASGPAGQSMKRFAEDDASWQRSFRSAWAKATQNGFSSLQRLDACSAPTGAGGAGGRPVRPTRR